MNEQLISVVNGACEALTGDGERRPSAEGVQPRFELFHAASSICSQKVRAVLAHHGLPYVEHSLNMFLGQTYLPGYVRLRMLGCERYGGALVSRHSGSTSAAAGGCDGAVVPTLVDWESDDVIVDSKRICMHVDDQMPDDRKLRPLHLAAAIDRHLQVIDNLPNYQMLMGRTVSDNETSNTKASTGAAFSERKVAWCDKFLGEFGDDPVLKAAYTAKRSKELSAASDLFSAEAMEAALENARLALIDLERDLAGRASSWLFGEQLTMADLFWGIELLRMKNTGFERFWEGGKLPNVERFSDATQDIPAIRTAILDWPGAMF